jgi:hypothetical protein
VREEINSRTPRLYQVSEPCSGFGEEEFELPPILFFQHGMALKVCMALPAGSLQWKREIPIEQ